MTAAACADLAEHMVPKACEFACLVHDGDRIAIAAFLAQLGGDESRALPVILAAMVPVDDRSAADLLAWVEYDERGYRLPVQVPGGKPAVQPCGTYAAYRRHEDRGELIDDDCGEAARSYWRARYERRKVARKAGPAATGEGREDAA